MKYFLKKVYYPVIKEANGNVMGRQEYQEDAVRRAKQLRQENPQLGVKIYKEVWKNYETDVPENFSERLTQALLAQIKVNIIEGDGDQRKKQNS